ncbi:MAG: hypothetical protein Q8P07_00405 [bacterium]|nr:hypothetical protein [bacterium]
MNYPFIVRNYIYTERFDTFTEAFKYAWKISQKNVSTVYVIKQGGVVAEITDGRCTIVTKHDPPSPW